MFFKLNIPKKKRDTINMRAYRVYLLYCQFVQYYYQLKIGDYTQGCIRRDIHSVGIVSVRHHVRFGIVSIRHPVRSASCLSASCPLSIVSFGILSEYRANVLVSLFNLGLTYKDPPPPSLPLLPPPRSTMLIHSFGGRKVTPRPKVRQLGIFLLPLVFNSSSVTKLTLNRTNTLRISILL